MSERRESWTIETLRVYFEKLAEANDLRYEERFKAQEKSVQVAEANAERWRANANEWRAAMNDREGKFASRDDLNALKERMDRTEGKGQGVTATWGVVIVVVTMILAAIGIVITR